MCRESGMSRESGINSDLWGRHLSVRDSSATALQRKLSPPHRLGNGVCSHVASNLQENPPEVSSSVAESSWSFPYREVQMVLGNSAKKKKIPWRGLILMRLNLMLTGQAEDGCLFLLLFYQGCRWQPRTKASFLKPLPSTRLPSPALL